MLSPHYKIKPCVSEVNHVPFNAFFFPPSEKSYKKRMLALAGLSLSRGEA